MATSLGERRPDQIVNVLRYEWHALRGYPVARLPYSPVSLNLYATQRCNLRCAYCSYHGEAAMLRPVSAADMTMGAVEQVLDRFPLAVSAVVGGAGEPLLHPDIFGILHLIRAHHMDTALVTNGTLLPAKLAGLLQARVGFVNVSFYGVDGETFARRTGAGAALFDGMVRAVAELARLRRSGRGPRLRGSFVCTKENLDEAIAFVALCEELGLDEAKLANLTDYGLAGDQTSLRLWEDDREGRAFIERLTAVSHRIPVLAPGLVRRAPASHRCHLPFSELTVGANAGTSPCCVEPPFLGRTNVVRNGSAWNAPELVARRRALADQTGPLPQVCRQCEKLVVP
jgi:MoaA/NifB/PqqE/SkfB family radical SAM enzyme